MLTIDRMLMMLIILIFAERCLLPPVVDNSKLLTHKNCITAFEGQECPVQCETNYIHSNKSVICGGDGQWQNNKDICSHEKEKKEKKSYSLLIGLLVGLFLLLVAIGFGVFFFLRHRKNKTVVEKNDVETKNNNEIETKNSKGEIEKTNSKDDIEATNSNDNVE